MFIWKGINVTTLPEFLTALGSVTDAEDAERFREAFKQSLRDRGFPERSLYYDTTGEERSLSTLVNTAIGYALSELPTPHQRIALARLYDVRHPIFGDFTDSPPPPPALIFLRGANAHPYEMLVIAQCLRAIFATQRADALEGAFAGLDLPASQS